MDKHCFEVPLNSLTNGNEFTISGLRLDSGQVIDGSRIHSVTTEAAHKVSPSHSEITFSVESCSEDLVNEAVKSAARAYQTSGWSDKGTSYRKPLLLKLADLIDAHAEELALMEVVDMGKPIAEAKSIDIPGVTATLRYYAESIDKLSGELPEVPEGATAMVERVPLGVVAAITPWNYPLEIAAWKIGPALASGNTVVLKPSSEAPHSALRIGELALEAGFPPGVLNVITGPGAAVGSQLANHMDVAALAFTGSTDVAKRMMQAAGDSNLKRLSLEAGGKSANLIFADCKDLKLAASKAAFGAYYNQGEVCSANSRILVEDSVKGEFIELMEDAAKAFFPGNPFAYASSVGALVSETHADKVWRAIEIGKRDGQVEFGAERLSFNGSNAFITPTLISGLNSDHELNTREIFGPVATIGTFSNEEEAVHLANSTDFGLAASVWTADLERAMRVSKKLVAGTVSVNTVDALGLTTPFGGFKSSGFGRDLSLHALNNYTDLKTTWLQWG